MKDVLLAIVLFFSGFMKGHQGKVCTRICCGPEGWSVSQTEQDGSFVLALIPDEQQCLIIIFYP